MKIKSIIAIALVAAGATCLFFSHYIAGQIAQGRQEIQSGQQKINTIDSMFSASPYTKGAGKQITKPGQQRIDAGNAEIAKYEQIKTSLQIIGVILIIGGIVFYFLPRRKK